MIKIATISLGANPNLYANGKNTSGNPISLIKVAPRAGLSLAIACFVSNPAPTASNAIGVAVCAT